MTTILCHFGELTDNHPQHCGTPVFVANGIAHSHCDMVDLGVFGQESAFEHGRKAFVPPDGLTKDQVRLMREWVRLGKPDDAWLAHADASL